MSEREIRRALTNAKFNNSGFTVVATEIFAIAIGTGIYFNSWAIGGGTWLVLIILINFGIFAIPYLILMSVCWAIIAFVLASIFAGLSGQIVIAIIAFVIAIGVHFAGIEHVEDISYYERY